jgi:hypothetical protein
MIIIIITNAYLEIHKRRGKPQALSRQKGSAPRLLVKGVERMRNG